MSAARKANLTVREWLVAEVRRAARTTPAGWHYANSEAFVLAHGRTSVGGRFSVDECRYVLESARRAKLKPVVGHCFSNSRKLLLAGDSERRLTYFEGFVESKPSGAIQHGWLELDGKIVDVTLNAGAFGLDTVPRPDAPWLGKNTPRHWGVEYFGVPFTREAVASALPSKFAIADYGPGYEPTTLREGFLHGGENSVIIQEMRDSR